MFGQLRKILATLAFVLFANHAFAGNLLYIQVSSQFVYDNTDSVPAAVLSYVANDVSGQPSYNAIYDIGLTNNSATTPYPTFTGDISARAFFDSTAASTILSSANSDITAGFFTMTTIQTVASPVLTDLSLLATVATTGSYTDLINKPTNVSSFTNDSGYLTSSSLSPYLTSSTAASTYFAKPTGTTSQYLRGDGSLATFPTAGTRSFAYPSRSLNSCFQISSAKDADFHYKVDVTGSLSLTSGTTGTVTATAYTNSGCTTGAQAIADGQSAQSGTLVIGLGINQVNSVSIDGTLPAGEWMKLTTANTVGTPTFAIRTVQAETIQP